MLLTLLQNRGGVPVEDSRTAGFEMGGGRAYRETSFKPILQRVLEAKAPKVKPQKERAAKRAKTIEQQAAILVANGGDEKRLLSLEKEWLAQKPYIPEKARNIPIDELFAAQVAFRINQMQLLDDDDEEAIIAILLS